MRSSFRKIGIIFFLILVLPVIAFSVFEIGNLRQNESVIDDIYTNQLNAILFSINQYSDDLISNLALRIEKSQQTDSIIKKQELGNIISEFPSIAAMVRLKPRGTVIASYPVLNNALLLDAEKIVSQNDTLIQKLHSYFKSGYRKIESIDGVKGKMQCLVFFIKANQEDQIVLMMLDPEIFISQTLDPKMQQIALNQFNIVTYRAGEDKPFYNSNKDGTEGRRIHVRKPFWLLKNYQMGIELRELTIADLAKERKKRNLILIALMDLVFITGAWIIFRNIRKQVELSQLKSDFVSSVSHEIRTPLALVSMYIETLDMGRITAPEKIKEYYSVIMAETARLSAMVNRILSFSQIENNKKKYVLKTTDLNSVIEEATLSLRNTLESKGFSYAFMADKTIPEIQIDRYAISDAFINLIDNAIKYSADKKEIVIRTGKNQKHVFVEVKDHGIGISTHNQRYIFDKFFRVTEKDLANKVKGSGLGLSIVKHIMDAHKGEIKVTSNPGEGSVFCLLFPVKN